MKNHLSSILSLLVMLLYGCQSSHTKIEEDNNVSLSLMLEWMPSPTHIPLYHGLREGFFEEEGINLEILKKGEGDALQLLHVGSDIDLVVNHLPRVIRLQTAPGFNMIVVGTFVPCPLNGFLARKDRISSITDFNGKRLGFSGSKFSSPTLDVLLQTRSVAVEDKINVRLDLLPQLALGNVDVVWGAFKTVEPFQLQAFGIPSAFFGVEDFGMPSYHEMIVVAKLDGKIRSKNCIHRFQKALQKSLNDARKRPDVALENYFLMLPEKGEIAQKWEKEAWYELYPLLSTSQEISVEKTARPLYEWMLQHQILKAPVDLNRLLYYMDSSQGSSH